MAMLKVHGIDVFYGNVQALFDVSIEVHEDEIVSIIGANGAGKTTLMKTIMGINRPARGAVTYNGEQISDLSADHHVLSVSDPGYGRKCWNPVPGCNHSCTDG